MTDSNDIDLVQNFARNNSEASFAELVHRHIDLVYSIALRLTRNAGDAEDVTQAVFIILARKSAALRPKTILTGWLYETTRFTAMKLLRTKNRQIAREQEAYMQSGLIEENIEDAWNQLAPVLEDGMSQLNEKDRTLLALRFFDAKSGAETAAILGIQEGAVHRRVNRAMEKLRVFFRKRGVVFPASVLAAAIFANSVQAAPATLAKSVTAMAVVKGVAANGSILTLIHGAMKLIAWTKMKTTMLVSASALLVTGAMAASIYETIWKNPNSSSYDNLKKAPPTLIIRRTQFPRAIPSGIGIDKAVYVNQTLPQILANAYQIEPWRMALPDGMPQGNYDYLATLPDGQNKVALRNEIRKQFGLSANEREERETKIYLLKVKDSAKLETHISKGGDSVGYSRNIFGHLEDTFRNEPLSDGGANKSQQNVRYFLECYMKTPILDRTGSTARYDIKLEWGLVLYLEKGRQLEKLMAIRDQLASYGLELVPSQEKIEMLVIQKAK